MKILSKKVIFGCESRGDALSPYLTRWTIVELPIGALYLHRFHRSDADEMHDHPWSFWSLILWRGYIEETPYDRLRESKLVTVDVGEAMIASGEGWEYGGYFMGDTMYVNRTTLMGRKRKRVWPGMLLRRRSNWIHRVELVNEREAWTLVWRGRYIRNWGFWTKRGWQFWKDYFKERGCR